MTELIHRSYNGGGLCQWCSKPATTEIENVPALYKGGIMLKRATTILTCQDCKSHAKPQIHVVTRRKPLKDQFTIV